MKYVYLLRSDNHPAKTYIGSSSEPKKRLIDHNAGKSPHTAKFAPWSVEVAVGFKNHSKALAFEKYLKIGSGHAFARRHFW